MSLRTRRSGSSPCKVLDTIFNASPKMTPPSAEDILVLAAALGGAAGLTSTTRVGIGGIDQEGIGITVKVTAPKATA